MAAGVLVLLGGVGVALGLFTGFGQQLLRGKPSAQVEQQLMSARKQMADDTLGSYRKAALTLQAMLETDPKLTEAAAVAAQARLGAARLGLPSELREADAVLAKITDEKAPELPDYRRPRRCVVGGGQLRRRAHQARRRAAKGAGRRGRARLSRLDRAGAGDPAAADKAFTRALAAEATRAAALYGDGVAKERLGDPPRRTSVPRGVPLAAALRRGRRCRAHQAGRGAATRRKPRSPS